MRAIYQKKINDIVTPSMEEHFTVDHEGLYVIEITASAKSWWQNTFDLRKFFKKDSLTIRIDDQEVAPQKKKLRADDLWNGNVLKGNTLTVYVVMYFEAIAHSLSFTTHSKPLLDHITIFSLDQQFFELTTLKAEKRDRTPWLLFLGHTTAAFSSLSIAARAEKANDDDDDLKLVIDGTLEKNTDRTAHKDWYWCGKILKGAEKIFQKEFSDHALVSRIDIHADGAPKITALRIGIKKQMIIYSKKDVQRYTYRGPDGTHDYNRFDSDILDAVNTWNKEFNDAYPPPEFLHPNLVKAMVYVESKMGYYEAADYPSYPDVMQVADPRNPAIHTLNNDGWLSKKGILAQEKEWKKGKFAVVNYGGKANGASPAESIRWGIRWLYHIAQGITHEKTRFWRPWKEAIARYNGGGDPAYSEKVYDTYQRSVDRQSTKHPIQLFLFLTLFLPLVAIAAFSAGAVLRQPGDAALRKEVGNLQESNDMRSVDIENIVNGMIKDMLVSYERQDHYYYSDFFQEPYTLCKKYEQECFWDLIFPSYLTDIISASKNMKNFLSAMSQFDIVTPATSILGDFDNDRVNELIVMLDDPLNHAYLRIMIVDQGGSMLKYSEQKIDRPYIGGTPHAVDLTGDTIPEIIVYATGGRQDIQAYIFQYDRDALHLLYAFERNYLRADVIFSDQNGNHIPEIIVRGEQYGDECMACEHAYIEEVFEYDQRSKTFVLLSSKLDKKDETGYTNLNE
ncbi:MAG: hypothetical protein AAB400_01160 [Patescibacteria group bacterium]